MTAKTRMYNGTVFNLGGTAGVGIVGISYKQGGNWVDVTAPEDVVKFYEITTQADLAVQLKFKGEVPTGFTRGVKATGCTIVWKDGTTDTLPGTWQVGPIEKTGDLDSPITGTIELRPTVPDA